jgi:hypothetical protein
MAKGTVVAKTSVKRKSGYLYFVDADGNVRETKMNRKGGKKGRKVCSTVKPKRKAAPKKKAAPRKRKAAAPKKRTTAKRKAAPKRKYAAKRKKSSKQLKMFSK